MKDNGFKLAKERSRKYPAQKNTDTNYADDITLQANTRTQAETRLRSLERVDASEDLLHINADKMEYMCFNQRGDISTVNGCSPKLVEKQEAVSHQPRPRHTTCKGIYSYLLTIGQIELSNEIKRGFFFQSNGRTDTAIWIQYMDTNKIYGENA